MTCSPNSGETALLQDTLAMGADSDESEVEREQVRSRGGVPREGDQQGPFAGGRSQRAGLHHPQRHRGDRKERHHRRWHGDLSGGRLPADHKTFPDGDWAMHPLRPHAGQVFRPTPWPPLKSRSSMPMRGSTAPFARSKPTRKKRCIDPWQSPPAKPSSGRMAAPIASRGGGLPALMTPMPCWSATTPTAAVRMTARPIGSCR